MGIGNKWADEEKVLGEAIYISKIKKGKLLALLFALAEGKLSNCRGERREGRWKKNKHIESVEYYVLSNLRSCMSNCTNGPFRMYGL